MLDIVNTDAGSLAISVIKKADKYVCTFDLKMIPNWPKQKNVFKPLDNILTSYRLAMPETSAAIIAILCSSGKNTIAFVAFSNPSGVYSNN